MPKYQQPPTIRDKCISKLTVRIRDLLNRWIEKLSLAASRGVQPYRQEVQNVTEECIMLNEKLMSLPIHILDDLSPQIVRHFVDEISSHDKQNRAFIRMYWCDENIYNSMCTEMLKSVLLPSTRRYDTKDISSAFAQKLIIQGFSTTRNLTQILFDTKTDSDNSALLARNIHHLRHLVTFQYVYHCTDKIVQQLALNCSELQKVDVSHSSAVTYVSVQHLLKLKNLTHVNVKATSISDELYGTIISELPKLATIYWSKPICNILKLISNANLQTITYIGGVIRNSYVLTQKCPNITIVVLKFAYVDLSSLTSLNGLVQLAIDTGGYVLSNMEVVLLGVGHRLQSLKLYHVDEVYITDIIMFCSSLETLVLHRCTFVTRDFYKVVKSELPHFKSVVNLTIKHNSGNKAYNEYLAYYVNLKVFQCNAVDELSDDFMIEAVTNGAFTKIQHFEVTGTERNALSINTAWLLINNCEHLKVLGNLGTWSLVTEENIAQLGITVLQENLDLKIIKT